MSWTLWQVAGVVPTLAWALVCGLGFLRVADRLHARLDAPVVASNGLAAGLALAAFAVGALVILVVHGFLMDGTFAD